VEYKQGKDANVAKFHSRVILKIVFNHDYIEYKIQNEIQPCSD